MGREVDYDSDYIELLPVCRLRTSHQYHRVQEGKGKELQDSRSTIGRPTPQIASRTSLDVVADPLTPLSFVHSLR